MPRTTPGGSHSERTRTPLPTSFSAALAEARTRSGLSQEGLARRVRRRGLRLTAGTVGHWETGKSEPRDRAKVRVVEDVLGQQPGALAIRLAPTTPDPVTHRRFRACSPDRLNLLVARVDERFQIGPSGRPESIVITLVVRALFDLSEPVYYFAYEQSASQRIDVEPLFGCALGNTRPIMPEMVERRIPLSGGPMTAGQTRPARFALHHSYERRFTERACRYRRMTSPGLEELALTVCFPRAGQWVEFCSWPQRSSPKYVEWAGALSSTTKTRRWDDINAAAYGFCWQAGGR